MPGPYVLKNYGRRFPVREKHSQKLALLAIPVLLWLAFSLHLSRTTIFGLKASATSSQPVARVRAYQQDPGTNLILGDSRLAHF